MIKPSIGRIVWFFDDAGHYQSFQIGARQPRAAVICTVWSHRCVNLCILQPDGNPQKDPPTSIPLLQEGDAIPEHGHFCMWMPYQQQQAANQSA